jgi:hypothetical protein
MDIVDRRWFVSTSNHCTCRMSFYLSEAQLFLQ